MAACSSNQVYVRRVTENIVARNVLSVKPKYLARFGWQAEMGVPRWRLSIGGNKESLCVNSDTTMIFNKLGRDGFPMKTAWVDAIVNKLRARQNDHEFVFRLLELDNANIMHVHVSLRTTSDRAAAATTSFHSDTVNVSADRSCSIDYDGWNDDEATSRSVCVKLERNHLTKFQCPTCDQTYSYLTSFRKHLAVCVPNASQSPAPPPVATV